MKFILYKKALRLKSKGLGNVSGWQDSNLRPPGPKPGAITGLRYIPNDKNSEIKTRCFYSIKLIFDSFFKKLLRRGRDSIRLRRNRFTPSHFKNFCREGGIRYACGATDLLLLTLRTFAEREGFEPSVQV